MLYKKITIAFWYQKEVSRELVTKIGNFKNSQEKSCQRIATSGGYRPYLTEPTFYRYIP